MTNTPTSTGRRGYVAVDRRWLADPNLSPNRAERRSRRKRDQR